MFHLKADLRSALPRNQDTTISFLSTIFDLKNGARSVTRILFLFKNLLNYNETLWEDDDTAASL